MYNLFLDDLRNPDWVIQYKTDLDYTTLEWVIVRSHDDFVRYILKNGIPNLISFDHDLADEHYSYKDLDDYELLRMDDVEKNGYESLKWICDYVLEIYEEKNIVLPKMKFHTGNIVGMKNMVSYYNNFIKFYPYLKNKK